MTHNHNHTHQTNGLGANYIPPGHYHSAPPEAFFYDAMGNALGQIDQWGRPLDQYGRPLVALGQAAPGVVTAGGGAQTGGWIVPLLILGGGLWAVSQMIGQTPERRRVAI